MGLFKDSKETGDSTRYGGGEVSSAPPGLRGEDAPCSQSCPVGTDVRELAGAAGAARGLRTARLPRPSKLPGARSPKYNPFPAICGRVCQHPCELNCNRKAKDGPVGINSLERFVGDYAIAQGLRQVIETGSPMRREAGCRCRGGTGEGFPAAYHLARKGYRVHGHRCRAQAGRNDALSHSTLRDSRLQSSTAEIGTSGAWASSSARNARSGESVSLKNCGAISGGLLRHGSC